MVEIFKTNVQKAREAKVLIRKLAEQFPKHKINFDLDDCDKILRVEGENIFQEKVIHLLQANNYQCERLE